MRIDALEFARLAQAAQAAEAEGPSTAIRSYESALALFQGDFLEDNLHADWAGRERERPLAEYVTAAERLARALLARQRGVCRLS